MVEVLQASGICGTGFATGFKVNMGTFVSWNIGREVVPLVSDGLLVRVEEFEQG